VEGSVADEMNIRAVLPGESAAKIIEIKAHGSDTAVESLGGEKCDIGMMSRKIKNDEVEKLARFGSMDASGSENVIAMDGIAIIVNRSNPVRELTLKQIAQIFTGGITNWSDIDKGRSGGITLYARDDKSGTFDTFKNLVLGKEKKLYTAKRFEDSEKLSDAVSSDPNGIGFVGLPFIGNAKDVAVFEEGGQPYRPARVSINQRKYLLHRELYFYLPQKSQVKMAKGLVDFALSDEGQDIVQKVGFVSQSLVSPDLNPTPPPETLSENIPPELAKMRKTYKGAGDLPPLFFNTSVSDLDNKSLVDFGRIDGRLDKDAAKEIVVVGFADNTGTPAKNLGLSKDRAEHVREEFIRIGRQPGSVTAKWFGQDAPAQSNAREEGRKLNRRVEIYYR
jgi:phosphate transport system substrate-binding protein